MSVRNNQYTQPMVLERAPRSQGHFEITRNPIKLYLLDVFVLLVCLCVDSSCVEVKENCRSQFSPSCGFQELNSSCWAWEQAPLLPTELPHELNKKNEKANREVLRLNTEKIIT